MSGARSGSDGFTLVEMLVVVLLATLVFGSVCRFLLDTVVYSQKSASTRSAERKAAEVLDRLGNDLRGAQSPERDSGSSTNLDQLRNSILFGVDLPGADLRDVTKATEDELWFRSDVLPESSGAPVTECVGYVFGSDRQLVRYVYSDWRACPDQAGGAPSGTAVERLVLVPPLPASDNPDDTVRPGHYFTYRLAHNGDLTKVPLSPDDCLYVTKPDPADANAPDLSVAELAYIVAVNVDLRSVFVRGAAYGESKARGSIALRLRTTRDYQYALGCAF